MKQPIVVFTFFIHVSVAAWQRVTVREGQSVELTCPITNAHHTAADWKTPDGFIMFYKHHNGRVYPGVADKRLRVTTNSESEFTVTVSDVTFRDGGNYTCHHYDNHVTERKVEVTVLGNPVMTKVKHDGKFDIKCTAEGNHHPPQIFWKFDNGPEVLAQSQVLRRSKSYVSKAMIQVQSVEKRVELKCLVRHPALLSLPLMDFIKIGKNTAKSHRSTTTSSWLRRRTTVFATTRDADVLMSQSPATSLTTAPSNQLFGSSESTGLNRVVTSTTGLQLSTDFSRKSGTLGPIGSEKNTISDATHTPGGTTVPETTEIVTSNHTDGNITGILKKPKMQTDTEGNSSLLVLLVTCLIFALLVVVVFFAIKLRRAHLAWKRENEDSEQSVESNKSKSSQEDRNPQGQRRRGLFNMAFTQYVVEEPIAVTSVTNPTALAATESVTVEHSPGQTSAKCEIKETEL